MTAPAVVSMPIRGAAFGQYARLAQGPAFAGAFSAERREAFDIFSPAKAITYK
jgi:hypothetical protein